MITITVCVGSSCYLRGAPDVLQRLEELIECHGAHKDVVVKGSFCMEQCTDGVTVQISGRHFNEVTAETIPAIFRREVLGKSEG